MVEDVFDNKYPVPRYPYSQTHAALRRSTTQNLPPDPVFVHLKYNAADRPNMRWTQRNARCAGINENQLPATRGALLAGVVEGVWGAKFSTILMRGYRSVVLFFHL